MKHRGGGGEAMRRMYSQEGANSLSRWFKSRINFG